MSPHIGTFAPRPRSVAPLAALRAAAAGPESGPALAPTPLVLAAFGRV